jgi:hypothetical protein
LDPSNQWGRKKIEIRGRNANSLLSIIKNFPQAFL